MSGARRVVIDDETAAELLAIDTDREEAFAALGEANRAHRGQIAIGSYAHALDDVLARFADADQRVDALQRRVWPRYRGRLVVALGTAVLMSPTGRSSRLVWSRGAR